MGVCVCVQDKVLVGHALHHDLAVLRMSHVVPVHRRRDTSRCLQLRQLAGLHSRPVASLKALSRAVLGECRSHCLSVRVLTDTCGDKK